MPLYWRSLLTSKCIIGLNVGSSPTRGARVRLQVHSLKTVNGEDYSIKVYDL